MIPASGGQGRRVTEFKASLGYIPNFKARLSYTMKACLKGTRSRGVAQQKNTLTYPKFWVQSPKLSFKRRPREQTWPCRNGI